MGLSRTVSEIDDDFDFSQKSQNFPTPLYFAPPLKGFPLELSIGAGGQKTRMLALLVRQRRLTISSAVWIECTNVTNRRTDGHRATAKTALTHSVRQGKDGIPVELLKALPVPAKGKRDSMIFAMEYMLVMNDQMTLE